MITETKQSLYISQTSDDRNLINPINIIQIRERLLLRDYFTLKKKEKSHFRPPIQLINESNNNNATLMTLGDNK
jgi:hypothetical protein